MADTVEGVSNLLLMHSLSSRESLWHTLLYRILFLMAYCSEEGFSFKFKRCCKSKPIYPAVISTVLKIFTTLSSDTILFLFDVSLSLSLSPTYSHTHCLTNTDTHICRFFFNGLAHNVHKLHFRSAVKGFNFQA